MKRWLVRICVFLLLGAIVNVAVAWGCALNLGDVKAEDSLNGAFDENTAVSLTRYSYRNTTRLKCMFVGLLEVDRMPAGLPSPRSFEQIASPFGLSDLASAAARSERGRWGGALLQASGWPLQSTATAIDMTLQSGTTSYRGVHAGIALTTSTSDIPTVLPLRPLWPGFAINTVFYAVVVWLLFAGPFVVRRWRRIRRGLCPKCAYDLRGTPSEACPECGAALA